VSLCYGRQSLEHLAGARRGRALTLLVWSYEAPSAQYMIDWAAQSDPARRIEIALAPGWPNVARQAPVIDFSAWNGERGGRAWNALTQRVRGIGVAMAPKKPPPKRPAIALAAASVAAVLGALFVRVHDVARPAPPEAQPDPLVAQAAPSPGDGVGGPILATEPASVDDLFAHLPALPAINAAAPTVTPLPDLIAPELTPSVQLRAPTLMERLAEFNPLRRDPPPEQR